MPLAYLLGKELERLVSDEFVCNAALAFSAVVGITMFVMLVKSWKKR